MSKVAFLGLGVMGYAMAGHLATKGFDVCVYNRTFVKAEKWLQDYATSHKACRAAKTPREAANGCEIVFACVGDDNDLRSVVLGEQGALAGMDEGSLFVDHTTASASVARELYAAAKNHQIDFIDAPVSGGQAGAEKGILTVMCGGEPDAFQRALPFINSFALSCQLMGGPGAGQQTKMVNQICIAGLVQALAEGLNFGKQAGLDMDKVIEVISKGAAGSWQMENRAKTMVADQFDFGFAIDWMRKDLSICLNEARCHNADLPVTALVDQFYAKLQRQGANKLDTSALMRLLTNDQS